MKPLFAPLALALLVLAGCSAVDMPGSAQYYSNQPGGMPFFRVSSGLGGPTLAVRRPDGKWTPAHVMKPLGANEPPLSNTPGLTQLVESAHKVDDYVFMEFKPSATFQGRPVPTRYYLFPGGFAYPVLPTAR